MIIDQLKSMTRKTANALGFEITRLSKVPSHNALGLRALGIRTVIDVGANVGQFARYMRSILPDARILSFEPLQGPFGELKDWASRQDGRVSVFNVALGEKEDSVEMFQHSDFSPSSSMLRSTSLLHSCYPLTVRETPLRVSMMSLDGFLDQQRLALQPEILMKLDVQGYEDRVIRGAPRTFTDAKACVVEVTFDKLYENQCSFKDVWTLFDRLQYHYAGTLDQAYASDGHPIFADVLFLK